MARHGAVLEQACYDGGKRQAVLELLTILMAGAVDFGRQRQAKPI